jgi:hypothetical protein
MHRRPAFVLLALGAFLAPMLQAQTPRGPEIQVNQRHRDNQWLPRVAAAPNGDFVVVWGSDREPTTFDEPSQAWYRLFGANGAPKTAERRVSNRRGEREGFPAVAMGPDGGFIIVWHSGGERDTTVYGRRFNAAGQPLGNAFPLSAATAGSQYDPAVDVASDGSFVAVWLQGPQPPPHGETAEVFLRRFNAAGQPPFSEVQVAPAEPGAKAVEPRVGMDGSRGWVISWLDSGAGFPERRLLARRLAGGNLSPVFQVNTGGPIATVSPLYDMDVAASGEAVFVWTAFDTDVIRVGILGRLFAADGTPGDTFEVNDFDVPGQERPAVAFGRDGGFLAAWRSTGTEEPPQPGNALYVRRFHADGTPRGGKIEIARSRQTSLDWLAVALNAAGRGAVAWTAVRFDAEILARRLVQAAP